MTGKNDNRIRKKSKNKNPNRTKRVKPREKSFDIKKFSLIIMVLQVFLFVFILSSNTGFMGDFLEQFFGKIFGKLSLVFPILMFLTFLTSFRGTFKNHLSEFVLAYIIYLLVLGLLSKDYLRNTLKWTMEYSALQSVKGGGGLGGLVAHLVIGLIGELGLYLMLIVSSLALIIDLSPLTYREFFGKGRDISLIAYNSSKAFIGDSRNKIKAKNKERQERKAPEEKSEEEVKTNKRISLEEKPRKDLERPSKAHKKPLQTINLDDLGEAKVNNYRSRQVELADLNESFKREFGSYTYPAIDLLDARNDVSDIDNNEIKEKARAIEETLDSFAIEARVVQIDVGPTVTCYELKPQRGVKVSKIVNLADDLSLALATSGIRILAPIPGKSHIGIEVPNDKKEVVGLKEIISSEAFVKSKYKIPFAMGKSISGDIVVSAIEKMPHLLVSGATGSGKSVCINTIIMSILYKHSPEDVKLLLIDPKVVELSIYNGIPHLIMPVITDPKKASSSLFWGISEMERRYKLFESNHVRDIVGYKKNLESDDSMEKLPYIVIIIDELADLMMTVGSEVEDYITRLAQKSRACGIHLIIATQRPTVDVITGTIKANIPSRISFAVTSQIDSRTILDTQGAEKLLGKGDMLYASSDSMRPVRIQGAFVSDNEVIRVVESLKEDNEIDYNQEAIDKIEEESQKIEASEDEDELIDEAIKIIINEKTASVSLLQRKLKIGYARAGRLIDQLETRGLVGGYEGSKPRKVLVDKSYLQGEENELS
ncbi:DNA translocase FtsK [Anaerococcus sp. AGMB09787]|uniref:DNA translocase FtsK n=1 Tax=Anaerococcus sp. AGMB09787 TaxID=2922869 RepID=UPI001FB0295C|nr:DNA translocase FtsK [Anaerococcus sp. AGMB09787]